MGIEFPVIDAGQYFDDPALAQLMNKIQLGDEDAVRAALKSGVSPNVKGKDGMRPIYFALWPKTTGVLKILLDAGADPMARRDKNAAPLNFAVRRSDISFAKMLLAYKADPNSPGENGRLPMVDAMDFATPGMVELLAASGANINAIAGFDSMFLTAILRNNWDAAASLIKLGVDVNWKRGTGQTGLDIICSAMPRFTDEAINKARFKPIVDALAKRGVSLPCPDQAKRW